MSFLKKVQNFSGGRRKIILWSVVIIVAIAMLIIWFSILPERFQKAGEGKFFKEIDKSFKEEMNKMEIPSEESPAGQ